MAGLIGEQGVRTGLEATFRIEYCSAEFSSPAGDLGTLLELHYGSPRSVPNSNVLSADVPLAPLRNQRRERWLASGPVERHQAEGFELASNGLLLAGVAYASGVNVEADTRLLYANLLRLVAQRGNHLLRVWNVVPDLHRVAHGLDRYMLFCRGRAEAFEQSWGPKFATRLCAFSAVGSRSGPQVLYFLASKREGTPLENPRQMPAWQYPARYGPRSPSFARGLIAPDPFQNMVFVSGTASVVGHESRHEGDVGAQTQESLANVASLLRGTSQLQQPLADLRFGSVKVFVSRAEDAARIEEIMAQQLGAKDSALYVEADICRPELLVEIEGLAYRSTV